MAGILEGVRVVSFTTSVAGPNAGRLLAQSGAEVFKIESREGGLDNFRYFSEKLEDPDASPRFIESNANVRSVLINLKHPTGSRLAKELIRKSDVVLDNFRPEVLPRLGLSSGELLQLRPDLVIMKMPGLGSSGPKSQYGTWGSTLTAFSGMTYLWNHPNQPRPIGSQGVYPDYVCAALAPACIIAALLRRQITGRGAVLELTQVEATAYVLGVGLLQTSINGRQPEPIGNDWPYAAPHNCYPCQGKDRWCVIAVETDDQWQRLAAILDRPDLSGLRLAQRRKRLAELDTIVSDWTRQRDAHEIVEDLQRAGIASGVVQSGEDLFRDPHLRARGFVSSIDSAKLGHMPLAGVPMRLSAGGVENPRAPDTLGGSTDYVVRELLGYSREQCETWRKQSVLY